MTDTSPSGRPTISGTRHAISAGHYLAAAAGFAILEAGGNAVDAVKRFVECGGRDELGGKGDERWGGVECDG